jgi:hypothetical protein
MLYEAMTGRPPFDGAAIDVLVAKRQSEPPTAGSLAPAVPPDLDTLCSQLLSRQPEDRPTGMDVLSRLRSAPATASATPAGRTPAAPFVGRQNELGALRNAFDESRAGRGVIFFLHGESGLGKSALVRQFLGTLEPEAIILSGR